MNTYTLSYGSGFTTKITVKSNRAAKIAATRLSCYDGGSYAIYNCRTRQLFYRDFYRNGNTFGWKSWKEQI